MYLTCNMHKKGDLFCPVQRVPWVQGCLVSQLHEEYVDTDLWLQDMLSSFSCGNTHSNIVKQMDIDIPRCNVICDGEVFCDAGSLLTWIVRHHGSFDRQLQVLCTQAAIAHPLLLMQMCLPAHLVMAEHNERTHQRMWIHLSHNKPSVQIHKRMRVVDTCDMKTVADVQMTLDIDVTGDLSCFTYHVIPGHGGA